MSLSSCRHFVLALILFVLMPCLALAQTTNATHGWLGYPQARQKYSTSSLQELENQAGSGDSNAMFALFIRYDTNDSYLPFSAPALEWLTKAAESGHPEAQAFLGDQYEDRMVPNDMSQAIHWFRLSAAQSHSGGQYRLALCYLRGEGVELDEDKGVELMRLSADQGHRYALAKLSDLYARGIGKPRGKNDSIVSLLKRSAAQGFTEAYATLESRYEKGFGVEKDLIAAAHWYCGGSLLPNSPFRVDDTTEPSSAMISKKRTPFEAAVALFCKAVVQRDTASMTRIGQMYADGENVPQSPASAWQWFNYAVSEGSPDAATHRAEMEHRMTPDELTDAKAHANAFGAELTTLASRLHLR